jgi:hypothetical protein
MAQPEALKLLRGLQVQPENKASRRCADLGPQTG